MTSHPHIVVAGAGAIGCFCGGLWAAAGMPVTLLGRARVLQPVWRSGLRLTDYGRLDVSVSPSHISCSEDPRVLAKADIVIVAVKSAATEQMADLIEQYTPVTAPIVSFQNGMRNVEELTSCLPGRDVRAGMVPFNVVTDGAGGFHRASSGRVVIAAGPGHWAKRLSVEGLAIEESNHIQAVQWGKLLINLNNALNALSGLTLVEQLHDREWRNLMAAQMSEALAVLKVAGIRTVSMTPLPMWMVPHVLRLPTPMFLRIASQMMNIDHKARSSMAQDVIQGRRTEIESLQGEIIRLGQEFAVETPICSAVRSAIHLVEKEKAGLPNWEPGQILSEV